MMLPEILAVLMVATVIVSLMFGYPVALTLGGVSLIFATIGYFVGAMDFGLLGALPARVFGVMTNEVLLAIPLFVFMGVMLERSAIAEELLEDDGAAVRPLARRLRDFGGAGRDAARRREGRCGRDHRDHGVDSPARHAAAWLRQAAGSGHRCGHRDAGANFSTGDRTGTAGRSTFNFVSSGATCAGKFCAIVGDGERSICRRDRAGIGAGGALHSLFDFHGGVLSKNLTGHFTRAERAEGHWHGVGA